MASKPQEEPRTLQASDTTSKNLSDFDQFLEQTGGFGLYQGFIVSVLFIMMMAISFHGVLMVFAAVEPAWKCSNNTTTCTYNGTVSGDNYHRCGIPRSDWHYVDPRSSIVSEFNIDCDRRWWIYVTSSVFFIGWCIGACLLGWLGELYGRRTILFPSIGVVLLLGFASSFSPNVYVFSVFRFVIGFAAPGVQSQAIVLASEITGTRWRGAAVTATTSGYSVGCMTLTMVAYYVSSWKWILIYSTLPYTFIGVSYKYFPESPRWLIVKGRSSSYSELIKTMAKWNKMSISEFSPPACMGETTAEQIKKPRIMDIFREGVVKALTQVYLTFCIAVVFFGILLSAKDLGGNLYTNFLLLSLTDLASFFVLEWALRRLGRRNTIIPSMLLVGALCLSIAFTPRQTVFNVLRTGLGLAGIFFSMLSFTGFFTWSPELYPTALRSTAVGFFQFTLHIGGICAPWIANGLLYFSPKAPFVMLGLMALVAGCVGWVLPETKGRALDEGH